MERVRFRIEVVRRVAVALYLLAVPVALLGLLPREASIWVPGVLAAAGLGVAAAGLIALRPPSVTLLRVTTPAAVALIGVAVASSGGRISPFLELLVLPLVFAAVVFDRRTALPTLVAFLIVRLAVVVTADTVEQLTPLVIATFMEVAVAVLVAGLAERMVHGFELDRLRACMSSATTPDELGAALAAMVLGDDIVAAAIVTVDEALATAAEIVASVGHRSAPAGLTTRVVATDSFARAAVLGPVVCVSERHSDDAGARTGFELGYGSQAVLPLRPEGLLLGFLVLSSDRRDAFSARRLASLDARYRALGAVFGSYLVRRERDARLRTALVGATLSRELAAAKDLEELLDVAARRMSELLGTTHAIVLAADPAATHLLRVVASSGAPFGAVVDTRVEPSGAQLAMSRREPVFVPDAPDCAYLNPRLVERLGAESVLLLPLLDGAGARGCFSCAWNEPRMIRQDEIDLARFVAAEVSAAWGRLEAEERLRHQASRDSLTGLLNHAAFHDEVRRALARLARQGGPVALILIDLDHLKHLNDFHGHAAGDAAIRAVADALRATARGEDVVGRLGGDEFAWLLHGSPDDALTAAQRTVAAVGGTDVPGVGALSISAGVAVTAAAMEPEALFELADGALYAAKADGRGTAVLAGRRADRTSLEPTERSVGAGAHEAAGAGDATTASRAVVRDWIGAFRVSGCALSLLVDGGTALQPVAEVWGGGLTPLERPETLTLADHPSTARALEDGATYACSLDSRDADPTEVARLRRRNAGAVLVVPLLVGDRPVGAVELFDSRPRRFSGDEQRLALTLGGYVAAVLDRVVA